MCTKLVLICVVAFVAFGRTDGSEITEECRQQLMQLSRNKQSCINRSINQSTFLEEFNNTVIDFSGRSEDLPQVEVFFTKYCGIASEVFQCVDTSDSITDECKAQIPDGELKDLMVQAFKTLAKFACDSDADKLKSDYFAFKHFGLVPNNGFIFLIYHNDFDRCVGIVKKEKTLDGFCAVYTRIYRKVKVNH